MSFDFSSVATGKRDHKKIIFLYGVPGIGKTTACANLPNTFFVPVEDGTAELENAQQYIFDDGRVKLKTYDEVVGVLTMIYNQGAESGIENLVIDSVSALEPLIHDVVCKKGDEKGVTKENIEDFGYGGGYKRALKVWSEFFELIEYIRAELKINVWLIGHSQVKTVNDPENEPYDRYLPELHKDAVGFLQKNCDGLIFAKYKKFIRKVKGGMDKDGIAKAVGTGERVIHTTERPSFLAKNRSQKGLPDEMPLDLNALLAAW